MSTRRQLLKNLAALSFFSMDSSHGLRAFAKSKPEPFRRVRPGDPGWPAAAGWEKLNHETGGSFIKIQSPFVACTSSPNSISCTAVLKGLKNPYYIGDQPALTQASGWLEAWEWQPSTYVVAARNTADVAAAVNFARRHNLRLVVKGGGHSYQGTSDSADSLLVWTRHMNTISLQDAFVGQGCEGKQAPQPAVTIGAGAMWIDAYHAVTTQAGRYVQGGGCTTVGVPGLVQSGGFGSYSKHYGTAAAGLLEAEIVTADGKILVANACTNPDLFWGLKGGGGGSLGVVTRLTLRTHELPEFFGAAFGKIKASSDTAYRELIAKTMQFYHDSLFNHHWGEQIRFETNNTMEFSMLFHGLHPQRAKAVWKPFLDWIASREKDFSYESPMQIFGIPARHFWDVDFLKRNAPDAIITDNQPGTPEYRYFWASNQGEAGAFLYAYKSAWLPASLLQKNKQAAFADALFAASRHWGFSLHFNKGLAGAPAEAIEAARDTATNPDVLKAFALAIVAAEGPPAYKGMPGARPDMAEAQRAATAIGKAKKELDKVAPHAGSYVSESDFFEKNWQQSFWGSNYQRLAAVKKKYDPEGLFFVHHGVGSEEWSGDGFTRLTK